MISWFEIPTHDIDRARNFYETVLGIEMTPMQVGDRMQMMMFSAPGEDTVSGALVNHQDFYQPSESSGPLVYLNAGDDVQDVLEKVEDAGGKIIVPKKQVSDQFGYIAVILDSEGNRVAFHSRS